MKLLTVDILTESVRAVVVGACFVYFLVQGRDKTLSAQDGWKFIVAGFALIFFGTVIDFTDNFDALNVYVVIGKTPVEAFLEKIVGYTLGFGCLAYGFWKWIPGIVALERTRGELRRSHDELAEAIANVKILQGMLPICASCKRIRDDEGFWRQFEDYLSRHSEARFTHGICPECSARLQAELGPDES